MSLTDPFGLCPDSSSAFKNFCIGVANFDWKAAGHTALDVAGLLWDVADWINVAWYLYEENPEQAAASAICALPGAGMALGGKMMKSQKLYKAGKIVKVISAGAAGGMGLAAGGSMGLAAGGSMIMAGITNIMNGLEEGRIDFKGVMEVVQGGAIAYCSGKGMAYNFKGLLSAGDNAARSSRISETASETMASGKGSKGSTNAAEPPSVYGKGYEIETNGFGPDTIVNRNANYGAKTADPSYGVSARPIGEYQLGTTNPSLSYTTGTSRMGAAAGAEEKIWLKAADGAGTSGVPGRQVQGNLGSTGISVGKPKVPDVPEIGGKGIKGGNDSKLVESANSIIEKARLGSLKRGKNYHGRLSQELEHEILAYPDAVYVTNNTKQNFVYRRGNNVVIVESRGSSKGNIITSYGPDGPRGESGAAIFGGNPDDPGMPVTHEDILNGIKQPGGTFPPATQIK